MFFCDGAKDGEADGMIAADANATGAGFENRRDSPLDALEGVFDGKWIDGKIAKVRDAMFRERIQLQDRIPGADDCGLYTNIAGAEARSGAVGCASVEGNADESDVEFLWLSDVRKAHEGRDASETGIAEGVERLGMGQTKGASGFGHGEAY